MKYSCENCLEMFEFHDAEFSFESFENSELMISVKYLNIHKNTAENPYECDMEIELVKLKFSNLNVIAFEPMRAYKEDENGNLYTDDLQVIYKGQEANGQFISALKQGFAVNSIDVFKKDNKFYAELSSCSKLYFIATFSFDSVKVEWDNYCKKAWYELQKRYVQKSYLNINGNDKETEIQVVHYESDESCKISIGVKCGEKVFWGHGNEYTWEDAFANLQKQLPEGVLLKCCMTCRHGNFCPYGNEPGKIFCIKEVVINTKQDVCELYDLENYTVKKSVMDCCDDFKPQSDDYYTYNDFLHFLKK